MQCSILKLECLFNHDELGHGAVILSHCIAQLCAICSLTGGSMSDIGIYRQFDPSGATRSGMLGSCRHFGY
jgi:hypothetical protein